MAEFFHMGGYAFYVWMSYGLAALILVLNIVIPTQQHKRLMTRLSAFVKQQGIKP
ncbi:MAG: heme exporter protein CcmD [Gammaproteobacteria bacterium]|nr:heme exporter protein CcmD [Gammaproteobacteria bacterium]